MNTDLHRTRVLFAGICSLILSIGIARFAYTPLLPVMQQQANLGVVAAGWLAAINYAGYLSGALLASLISDLVLKDKLYRCCMLMAVITTAMMGMTTDPLIWAISRFFAGLSSVGGMLLASGLILNWLIRHNHRSELGLHFAGVGIGIASCAVAVSLMSHNLDWKMQWYALTLLGSLLLIPALAWLPAPDPSGKTNSGTLLKDSPPSARFMRLFMVMYFCTGMAYVVGATFMVAIVDHLPGLAGKGNLTFLAIGIGAAPASVVWDLIARRIGNLNALILAAIVQISGILLPVVIGGLLATLIGALLFGATFLGMVSLVLTMAGRYYPTRPAKMMGKLTIAYGLAQIIGPLITGWMATRTGSYASGLYVAAAAMVVGTVLLVALKRFDRDHAVHASLPPPIYSRRA